MKPLPESCTLVQRAETAKPERQTPGEKRGSKIASTIAGGVLTVAGRSMKACLLFVRPVLRPLIAIVQLWYESAPAGCLCMTLWMTLCPVGRDPQSHGRATNRTLNSPWTTG